MVKKEKKEVVILRFYQRRFNPKTNKLEKGKLIGLEPYWKKTIFPDLTSKVFKSSEHRSPVVEYYSLRTKIKVEMPSTNFLLEETPCSDNTCFIYPDGQRLVFRQCPNGGELKPCAYKEKVAAEFAVIKF